MMSNVFIISLYKDIILFLYSKKGNWATITPQIRIICYYGYNIYLSGHRYNLCLENYYLQIILFTMILLMLYSNFVIIIHISCLIAQFKLIIHIYNPNNFFLCSFLKHIYCAILLYITILHFKSHLLLLTSSGSK